MMQGGFSCTPQNPKYTTFQVSRLGYKKTETPFLFVLSRVLYSDWIVSLNNSSDSPLLFYCACVPVEPPKLPVRHNQICVLACNLRSLGTAQVTSHDHCCSTASQLVESCVLSTRDATFVVYTPISRHESHHLVVSFTPTNSRSIRIGGVSPFLCFRVGRCPSEPPYSHTGQLGQIT